MKQYFKPLLSLLILGSLNSCKTEEEPSPNPVLKERLERIEPRSNEKLMNMIGELRSRRSSHGRTQEFDIGTIDMSEALMGINENDGTIRYSLRLEGSTPLLFENIIIREKEGETNSYLIRFEPDVIWLLQNNGIFDERSFTGKIWVMNMNRDVVAFVNFLNGRGYDQEVVFPSNPNGRSEGDCVDTSDGGSTGSGNIGDTGSTGGSTGPGGNNTGGGGDCEWGTSNTTGALYIDCGVNGIWFFYRSEGDTNGIIDDMGGGTNGPIGILSGSGDANAVSLLNMLEEIAGPKPEKEYNTVCEGVMDMWNSYPNNEVAGYISKDGKILMTGITGLDGGAVPSTYEDFSGQVYYLSNGRPTQDYDGMIKPYNDLEYYFIPVAASIHTHTPCRNDGTNGVSHPVGSDDLSRASTNIKHFVIGCDAIAEFESGNPSFFNIIEGSLSEICNEIEY